MNSWRPDSPVELPSRTLVCGKHGLMICGICTVDYSFTLPEGQSDYDAKNEEDEYEEADGMLP